MEKMLIVPSLMEGTPWSANSSSSSSSTSPTSSTTPTNLSPSPSPPNYPCARTMSPTKSPPMTTTTTRVNGNKWNGILLFISTFCILYVMYGKLEFFNLFESTFTITTPFTPITNVLLNDFEFGMFLFSFFF